MGGMTAYVHTLAQFATLPLVTKQDPDELEASWRREGERIAQDPQHRGEWLADDTRTRNEAFFYLDAHLKSDTTHFLNTLLAYLVRTNPED